MIAIDNYGISNGNQLLKAIDLKVVRQEKNHKKIKDFKSVILLLMD